MSISEVDRFGLESRQLNHFCACGESPAFVVTLTQPLVVVLGPLAICSQCMPGFRKAVDFLRDELRAFVVDVRPY